MYKHATRRTTRQNYELHDDIGKIKEALADATRDVKSQAGKMLVNSYEDMLDKSLEARENVRDYVAERPLKTIGFAVLTGLIVGFILRK